MDIGVTLLFSRSEMDICEYMAGRLLEYKEPSCLSLSYLCKLGLMLFNESN